MGKVQKVVVDSNVILSAFGWGGKPLAVMELLERGEVRNCLSEPIIKELIIALSYPKLSFPHALQANILEFVLAWSDMADPVERIVEAPDPADNKFIECAVAGNARTIITGDKRFLSLKRHGQIRILTPAEFLAARKKA